MSRITFASQPFMLGFEPLDRLVERTLKAGTDGYPPFNIEQQGEHAYRITLAVAGFSAADLEVTQEARQLVIRGRQAGEEGAVPAVYLHRGIAARPFQRAFVLDEHMEVTGASLADGLLHVALARHVPETVVRRIRIDDTAGHETMEAK